ncbi:hypothetical protein U0039_04800 [Stenotrophomonas maltophilia]|uniref:hypothetical protein n=1 Tax=Stenotrophomonas maltophilia TaxID=40324 RepID=UPI00046A5333|nr:hypothetical protein [Stenotrophomonas maltophilia]OMP38413.1 hypothetical protein BMR86_18255 [Stenotrophomonas sp. KAs 5-3]AIL06676.1 hypothetical protein DP16_908 [Stenotrophomonas maltophilia]OOD13715.1 hypothetical protein BWP19_12645 [Stenotrophomonas maltophilia]OWQ66811.1 hypothetical protein CEE58_04280 [Stenotrophomonas maltophilia]QQA83485.1 hypothetical protein I6I01_03395 [Stenotrophomonas maltophilia]
MAYAEFSNVPNVQTLIDLVVQFAQANGWTVERNNVTGANRTATVRIPGVSDYVHLFNTDQLSLQSRLSVGYNGALDPASQPLPSPRGVSTLGLVGPFPRVKLFANGTAIHVAIAQATAGEYRHHAFGVLAKAGAYEGGTYVDGTYWPLNTSSSGVIGTNAPTVVLFGYTTGLGCGQVRADSIEDGRSNSYHMICNNYAGSLGTEGQAGSGVGPSYQGSYNDITIDHLWLGRALGNADENTFSGRSIFHPIQLWVRRAGTTPNLSPIGEVIGLRACYLEKLEPEQEIAIGAETWVVFPWVRKLTMASGSNQPPASNAYGWAVRKS